MVTGVRYKYILSTNRTITLWDTAVERVPPEVSFSICYNAICSTTPRPVVFGAATLMNALLQSRAKREHDVPSTKVSSLGRKRKRILSGEVVIYLSHNKERGFSYRLISAMVVLIVKSSTRSIMQTRSSNSHPGRHMPSLSIERITREAPPLQTSSIPPQKPDRDHASSRAAGTHTRPHPMPAEARDPRGHPVLNRPLRHMYV